MKNGTYVDIEDIGIYNGEISNTGKVGLANFKYESKKETSLPIKTSNTSKNDSSVANKILPKAGISAIGILILGTTIIATIILYLKNRKYKDIK